MPITPTYPGIYILELPSSTHTIAAAPTSIAVFVGYTHPFKTQTFNKAVQLFSFTDYERAFGGLFSSGLVASDVPYAVNEFFLNGGTNCYVVGLQAKYQGVAGTPSVAAPSANVGGIAFTALEPTDGLLTMSVTLNNPKQTTAANDTADVTLAYGPTVETFRGVRLDGTPATNPGHIENRINGVSTLATVAAPYPANFTEATDAPIPPAVPPAGFTTTFGLSDFLNGFEADSDLDKVALFNLMALPGVYDNSILSAALAFCERKQAFLIMDPPSMDVADGNAGSTNWIGDFINNPTGDTLGNIAAKSPNGALYFPYLTTTDPLTGKARDLPPSGYVAGIYARTDLNRGVWKAPAGLEATVNDTRGVVESGRMTDPRQGVLNDLGVNCLRAFPGIGTVVFGARTLVSKNPAFQQWMYVPVRRMALFIEQTLLHNLGWAVFEPNDVPLWNALRTTIENFMLGLFNQGALQGTRPSEAFQVKCDATTTTPDDVQLGIVNIVVAFAPLRPAEFVVIKIAQLAGQAQS